MVCLWDCCHYHGKMMASECNQKCLSQGMMLPSAFNRQRPQTCVMHSNAQSDQVADSYQRNDYSWFMDTSVLFLTDVTYDFSKHIWLTDRTPVPSMYWDSRSKIIISYILIVRRHGQSRIAKAWVAFGIWRCAACGYNRK